MSIDRTTIRSSRSTAPRAITEQRSRIISWVRGYTGINLAAAAIQGGLAAAGDEYDVYLMVGGVGCLVMASLGWGLLCLKRMLSHREEYYRQGQLDGWIRGWNGQPPEVTAPGLE